MSGVVKAYLRLIMVGDLTEKVPCDKYDSIIWSEPAKGNRIVPPLNIGAVAVDLVSTRGAIRIYE